MVNLKEELKQAGLKSYEADAYETLLKGGTLTGNEIAKEAGIPLTRVFDVLKSLVEKELVLRINKRPMLFRTVEPGTALKNFFEKKINRLKETEKSILSDIDKIKKRKPETKLIEKVKILAGSEALWKLTEEMIKRTEKSIKIVRTYDQRPARIFDLLHSLLKRGKQVRIITTSVSDEAVKRMREDIERGIEIKYYPVEELRFVIIDGKEAFQSFVNPRNKEDRITIHAESRELSNALENYFDKIWKKAEKIKA